MQNIYVYMHVVVYHICNVIKHENKNEQIKNSNRDRKGIHKYSFVC